MQPKSKTLGSSSYQGLVYHVLQLGIFFGVCILVVLAGLYVLDQQEQRRHHSEHFAKNTIKEVQFKGVCVGLRSMVMRREPAQRQMHWTIGRDQFPCTVQDTSQKLLILVPPGFGPSKDGTWFVSIQPAAVTMQWSTATSAFTIQWPNGTLAPSDIVDLRAPIELMEQYAPPLS
jgi:hypothetical protein